MSVALTEVDEFTASVIVPEDGDPRNAASVVAGFQPLANRTLRLRNRVPGAAAFFTCDIPLGPPSDPTTFSFVNGPFALQQDSTTSPFHFVQLALPMDLQGGYVVKISEVRAHFLPANAARGGNAPASQPEITLWRQPRDGSGSGVSVQAAQLTAASEAGYELAQNLLMTIAAGGHTILDDHTYWVSFEGESGANSAVGLLLTRLSVTFAVA